MSKVVFGDRPCSWCQFYMQTDGKTWRCSLSGAELSLEDHLKGHNCGQWKLKTRKGSK